MENTKPVATTDIETLYNNVQKLKNVIDVLNASVIDPSMGFDNAVLTQVGLDYALSSEAVLDKYW